MPDIKYEIIKKIGILSKSASGWAEDGEGCDAFEGRVVRLSLRARKELLNRVELELG